MSKRTKVLLFLVLLALPLVGRLAWFYRGWYPSPTILEAEGGEIAVVASEHRRFEDRPVDVNAHVVLDLSHANRLDGSTTMGRVGAWPTRAVLCWELSTVTLPSSL